MELKSSLLSIPVGNKDKAIMKINVISFRYGVKEFIVISPAEDAEAVDNESKCHLLLSSIGIAATNSKW